MESSDCVPTEDAVQALIDFLVCPFLPAKSFFSPNPSSLEQQESVAKQLHAVVLLYNYYHRKQFPQLESLDFESFCKLASIAQPNLMAHMKAMHRPKEIPDIIEGFSISEKMIREACGICACLEISTDAQSLMNWPVSKVAVLLADQTNRFCFLEPSSSTGGLWSLIEEGVNMSEDDFLRFAFHAVKEKTGITEEEFTVLDRGITYSLSKQKTVVQFFLMQYHGTLIDEFTKLSIEDVIISLQGPLLRKDLNPTPAVEYFHLLPYAEILSDWLSRQIS